MCVIENQGQSEYLLQPDATIFESILYDGAGSLPLDYRVSS